ncbi:threonylcarbamoyl-AMP synthase [Candidatus Peregrinibacteria bacterium]|nr:threonylcarbamoyl-AMP synthase [Candidatus Peregrinibacteria bacterium]
MKSVPVNKKGIQEAIAILKKGGVVAYPADTCFGLAADMRNSEALNKIIGIKGRSDLKPMSVMFGRFKELEGYIQYDDELNRIVLENLFPGPYTIVLPKGPKVPVFYFRETNCLGVRIPNHALSLELIEGVKGPLITTSANRSGQPLTFSTDEVIKGLKNNEFLPDLIFEGEIRNQGGASTVLQIKDGKAILIREGIVKKTELERRLGLQIV